MNNTLWHHAMSYEGTGLRHICDATGLQKGSLYKAFAHKHDMYIKALSRYETTIIDQTVLALTLSDVHPRARLKAFLSAPIEAVWNQKDQRGCFLCNAAADYAAHDGETQNRVKHGYAKLENALRVPVSEIHPDWPQAKINKTAQLLLSIYSKRATGPAPLVKYNLPPAYRHFLCVFYGLYPPLSSCGSRPV